MIKQASPGKVRGKPIKYKLGDCLAIKLNHGNYLGALITGKFNAYYNFALMDFYNDAKPGIHDFTTGKFFGTCFGTM